MDERSDLDRFVDGQDVDGTYDRAVRELRRGRKDTHWMWFVFPQIAGLGRSPTSQRYAIASLAEARAYLAHPVLGRRLVECAAIIAALPADSAGPAGPAEPAGSAGSAGSARSAEDIFGPIDGAKLRSSMTLFHRADPTEPAFGDVLERYFGGRPDPETDRRL